MLRSAPRLQARLSTVVASVGVSNAVLKEAAPFSALSHSSGFSSLAESFRERVSLGSSQVLWEGFPHLPHPGPHDAPRPPIISVLLSPIPAHGPRPSHIKSPVPLPPARAMWTGGRYPHSGEEGPPTPNHHPHPHSPRSSCPVPFSDTQGRQ